MRMSVSKQCSLNRLPLFLENLGTGQLASLPKDLKDALELQLLAIRNTSEIL